MVNLPSSHYGERHTLATMNVDIHEGWIEVPLGQQIKRFKAAFASQIYIAVTCKPNSPTGSSIATNGAFKPILSLTYVVKTRERRTSSAGQNACNTSAECCRKSFTLNFADINWNFVVRPLSYNLYYCKGTCLSASGVTGAYSSSHAQAVTTRLLTNPTQNSLSSDEKQEIAKNSVCCVPTSFGSLTMLYQQEDDTIEQRTLSDMIVNSCGCEGELR